MSTEHEQPDAGRAEDPAVQAEDSSPSFWSQWPVFVGLTLVWGALWQDFSPGVLLAGLVFSVLTVSFYRLPRVKFSGRINPWYVLVFTVRFLWNIVTASASVAWDAIVKGPRIVNSVVAVPLRSHDDLIVTLTGHALALIPGSLVIDVDRPSSTLFLHCLNVPDAEGVQAFRKEALSIEAAIIRAIGSAEDLQLVREGSVPVGVQRWQALQEREGPVEREARDDHRQDPEKGARP